MPMTLNILDWEAYKTGSVSAQGICHQLVQFMKPECLCFVLEPYVGSTQYTSCTYSVPYAQVCLLSQEPSLGCTLKTANIAVYTHSLAFLNNEMATISHENCIH